VHFISIGKDVLLLKFDLKTRVSESLYKRVLEYCKQEEITVAEFLRIAIKNLLNSSH
jgi:hypothetical protein